MSRVLVIGGGAAGLVAAIAAAECGDSVTIVERMDRVGKKLLATGNGRCNLMNTGSPRYPGHADFAEKVLQNCGVEEQRSFWEAHGLRLREEAEGRVYPADGMAATVLDVLRLQLDRLHIQTVTGAQVLALRREGGVWAAKASENSWRAERVIVAGGGKAQPKLGSDGSSYALLRALGHRLQLPVPALTQIETERKSIAGLSGVRVKCRIAVQRQGKVPHREEGEALFTDYGLSGVCVMQCARYAREAGSSLSLSLLPAMGMGDADALASELARRKENWAEQPLEQLWTGLLPARIGQALTRRAEIHSRERRCASLTDREIEALVGCASAFSLRVTGLRGFESAQVTAGGIDPKDFSADTMASRLAPGLHAAGEVLDVDGDCGGFNLMFAFGSGILAGLNGRPAPWNK